MSKKAFTIEYLELPHMPQIMAYPGSVINDSRLSFNGYINAPSIDTKTWRLKVEGNCVSQPITYTYNDLLAMPATTIARYVGCADDGLPEHTSAPDKAAHVRPGRLGLYGIQEWTGVRLSYILSQAWITSAAAFVVPTGLDGARVERPIPADKAMQEDTILAYMVDGHTLTAEHGFPARCLVSGWVGVSNIKWVYKITVSSTPVIAAADKADHDFGSQEHSKRLPWCPCQIPWPETPAKSP
jgi:sulfane dehydrogenase subunit SoxC